MVVGQLRDTYQETSGAQGQILEKFVVRLEQHLGHIRVFNESFANLVVFKSRVKEWQLKRIRAGSISPELLSELDDIFQSFGPTHTSAYDGLRNICINFRP